LCTPFYFWKAGFPILHNHDERRAAHLKGLEAAAILLALAGIPLSPYAATLEYAFPMLALSVLLAAAGVLAATKGALPRRLAVFLLCAAALWLARAAAPRPIEHRDYVPRVLWNVLGWRE
jgi:hypothetical protein